MNILCTILLLSLTPGTQTARGPDHRVTDLEYLPDGSGLLFAVSNSHDPTSTSVYRADPRSGQVQDTLYSGPTQVASLALTRKGESVILATGQGRPLAISLDTKRREFISGSSPTRVQAVACGSSTIAFADNEGNISVGSDRAFWTWKATAGDAITWLQFHPHNEQLLLTVDAGRGVVFWDLSDSNNVPRELAVISGPVSAIAVSSDGTRLAIAGPDRVLRLFSIVGHTDLWRSKPFAGFICSLTFDSTGDNILIGTDGGASSTMMQPITVLDTATGTYVAMLHGHAGAVTALATHPDGDTIASGGRDGSILVQSLTSPSSEDSNYD